MSSRGINKVILLGHLGQDPEVRYSANGNAIANLRIATSYKPKDKDEVTEWHTVVIFGRMAEVANEYLHKGSQVYFEGRLQTRKWQDQSGNDRYSTEIVAVDMQLLGDRQNSGGASASPRQEQRKQPGRQQPAPKQDDGFDDIPF